MHRDVVEAFTERLDIGNARVQQRTTVEEPPVRLLHKEDLVLDILRVESPRHRVHELVDHALSVSVRHQHSQLVPTGHRERPCRRASTTLRTLARKPWMCPTGRIASHPHWL